MLSAMRENSSIVLCINDLDQELPYQQFSINQNLWHNGIENFEKKVCFVHVRHNLIPIEIFLSNDLILSYRECSQQSEKFFSSDFPFNSVLTQRGGF